MRLKFVGYDRAYDLHPSLLARRFLIEQVKLLVEDIFQVQKHKEECCLPSNNQVPLSSSSWDLQRH